MGLGVLLDFHLYNRLSLPLVCSLLHIWDQGRCCSQQSRRSFIADGWGWRWRSIRAYALAAAVWTAKRWSDHACKSWVSLRVTRNLFLVYWPMRQRAEVVTKCKTNNMSLRNPTFAPQIWMRSADWMPFTPTQWSKRWLLIFILIGSVSQEFQKSMRTSSTNSSHCYVGTHGHPLFNMIQ